MRTERRDSSQEKRILTAMITDDAVIARIASRWDDNGLFRSKWSNLIGGWCVRHYNQYDKAPKEHIESIYERWSERARDEATQKLVESFLTSLSEDHTKNGQPVSSEYVIDLAATHFNRVRKLRFIQNVQADLDAGDDAASDEKFASYNRIEMGVGAGVDVFHDRNAIHAAFHNDNEELITYPEALGNFFSGMLTRDAFIAFMAPPKRGKSFWLIDVAWRSMEQGRKVCFFSVGDMSQNQVIRRLLTRASRRPFKPTKKDKPVRYPKSIIVPPGQKRAEVSFTERHFKNALNEKTAWAACQKITGELDSKHSKFRISCHPNNTISVAGVSSILDGWDREGWTPDVIVVDYADLLAPITGKEHWEKVDQTWRHLRALSQSRHCLLVTANQGDAESLRADIIKAHHFSGSIGVLRHVTGMIGISQTGKEKKSQVCRLNWTEAREVDFDTTRPVYVAQCLDIANPAVHSIF